MHNVITRDGTPPEEFRRIAREELRGYPTISVLQGRVDRISPVTSKGTDGESGDTAYLVELEDGTRLQARGIILATGVRDELPDVPGIRELWGDLVVHCPFCHGHEFAGKRVAILGAEPAPHLARMMRPVASEVVVLTHGEDTPEDLPSWVTEVVPEAVRSLERHDEGVRVTLDSGSTVDAAGLFVATTLQQAAPFAEQLGLGVNTSGCTRVDDSCRSSLPRVYAAGDMAHVEALPMPMTSVAQAIASGALAGATAVADLVDAGD